MCCASITALLLLLQPIFCILHCVAGPSGRAHAAGEHAGHPGALLCHMAEPKPASQMTIIPAFWPGALPALLMLAAVSALISFVAWPSVARPSSRPWAPPIPPPRRRLAA